MIGRHGWVDESTATFAAQRLHMALVLAAAVAASVLAASVLAAAVLAARTAAAAPPPSATFWKRPCTARC